MLDGQIGLRAFDCFQNLAGDRRLQAVHQFGRLLIRNPRACSVRSLN